MNDITIKLIIDNREHALIELLAEMNIDFSTDQLDIGDVIVQKGNDTLVVFERKSLSDLKSSIVDGRYREQKSRLLSTHSRDTIVYLIEGEFARKYSKKVDGMPISTLIGAMINSQHRDGIKVYRTGSVQETAEYIALFVHKCKNGECVLDFTPKSDAQYASTFKKQKKANVTSSIVAIQTLSSIPRVSEEMAEAIIAEIGGLRQLFTAYQSLEAVDAENMLNNIKYAPRRKVGQSVSERKVGPSVSKSIYSILMNP